MQNWFEQENRLKFELGLEFDQRLPAQRPDMKYSTPQHHGGYCLICYEEISAENSFAMSCGHTFCKTCWQQYLIEKVKSGYTGIDARCMQAGCNLMVGHGTFESML